MRRERGTVFVFSLAVMAALVGVMAAVASSEHLFVMSAANKDEMIKARMACYSAFQRSLALFANDYQGLPTTNAATTSTSSSSQPTGATTLQDDWAQQGQNGDEEVDIDDAKFRMQVIDASSMLNTSALTTAWVQTLPMSQEQMDAYTDFTTTGETPLPDGGKDEYYNGLQNPYNAKLAPLDTLDELLQIRYFTATSIWMPQTDIVSTTNFTAGANGQQPALSDLLTTYSYSPNLQPGTLGQQQQRINVNTATQAQLRQLGLSTRAQQIILGTATGGGVTRRPNYTSLGTLLAAITSVQDQRIVLNSLSTSAAARVAGLINLNTCSQNVLATVPNLTPDLAQAIIQQQSTGFTQMSDLLNVSGFTGRVLQQTAQYFTTQSSTFIVRAIGYCGSASVAMEATIDITNNTPQIIRVTDVPFSDVIGRWNWNTDTTTQTILKEAS